MVHRGNLTQYTNINNSDVEKSSPNKKKYSCSNNNNESTDDSDEKFSPLSSSSLPNLLNGLELRKIESNEEEEKGKPTSPSSFTDNNIMNNNNNNNSNNINNNIKNEKIRLRRNSLLIGNRNLNKRSLLVPSSNMILKNGVDSSSSNSPSDTNTNGEIECNEIVGLVAKLPCSLPLERISGILEKLNIIPKISDSSSAKSSNSSPDITNGGSASGNKTMCLYCERMFSCQKLREKHAERVHQATKGRRLSSRTASATQSAYPGCSFCNVGKISLSEDLNDLFSHLIDSHPDKYFACKLCMIRFPSDNATISHNQEFHDLNNSQTVTRPTSPLNIEIDFENKILTNIISTDTAIFSPPANSNDEEDGGVSNRLRRTSTTRKKRQLLKNEELILSRLGVTQNRSPRTRRGSKLRQMANAETASTNTARVVRSTKTGRQTTNTSPITLDPSAPVTEIPLNNKQSGASTNLKNSDSLGNTTFDDDFYETVSLNVRKNLSCHLDGKLESDTTSPSSLSPVGAEPPLRATVVRTPYITDSEIHEATTLSAITAFPTLLTAKQYGSEPTTSKHKRTFTKNSWKWKWDFIKKYKYVNEGGKIVKKIKQQTSGFRDLSKLDMWTQLTMRSKHELICRQEHEENINNENATNKIVEIGGNYLLGVGEVAREEKRKLIDQLNTILDSRQLPQINLEQNDQRVIKQEPGLVEDVNSERRVDLQENLLSADEDIFAKMLKLRRKTYAECNSENRVVLSGEWARPRCYVCFGCGAKFETLKILEEHKNSSHPYVYSTHYEIVGRELIDRELYRHFYIPSKALHRHVNYQKNQQMVISSSSTSADRIESRVICLEDSMDSSASGSCSTITKSEICDTDSNSKLSIKLSGSSTASSIKTSSSSVIPASSSSSSSSSTAKTISKSAGIKCTKCDRECGGTLDLYRHMLDCSSDYAWILAKKRLRYRYFSGNRSRRRRAAGRNNFNSGRSKLMKRQQPAAPQVEPANIEEDENRCKKNKECITTPRSKPSDAESIERMLANLPAKRTCRQIIPNINSKKTRRVRKIIVPTCLKLSNQNKKANLQIQRRVTRTNALLTTIQTRNQLQNNRKINLRKRQVNKLNVEPNEGTVEDVSTLDTTVEDSIEDIADLSTTTIDAADTTSEALDTSESPENEEDAVEELSIIKPNVKKIKQKTKSKKMVRKMGKQFVGKHRMLRRSSAILLNASSSSSSEANSPAITKNIMKQISDINSKNEENFENEVQSTSHQHIKRQFKGNRLMRNNLNFTQTTRNFKLRPARLIVKSHLDEPEPEKIVPNQSKSISIEEVVESEDAKKSKVTEEEEKEPEERLEDPKPIKEDTHIDIIIEPVEEQNELIRESPLPAAEPTLPAWEPTSPASEPVPVTPELTSPASETKTSPPPKEPSPQPQEPSPQPQEHSPQPQEHSPQPQEHSPQPQEPSPQLQEPSPIINVVTKSKKKKGRPIKNPKPVLTFEEISMEEKIEEVTKVLEVTEMTEGENSKIDVALPEVPSTSSQISTSSHIDMNKSVNELIQKVEKGEAPVNLASDDFNGQAQKLVGAAKRKPKKLNDCIAMLTGKLQEKLGVSFLKDLPSSSNNKSPTLANHKSVSETEATSIKEQEKIDNPIQPMLRSPKSSVEVVIEQEDELVPLDLSIGKTKSDANYHRDTINLLTQKQRSIPLNALPVSLIKPIAIDLPKQNSSDHNVNLKLSEGTLLNLSPVKPIPHSELPFQAALPSSTLIYPARLSSVPRSNPFNTTNHSITIRPFISHSIPSMLSNTAPLKSFSKDNITINNKTFLSPYSNTTLPSKPSVSVCISTQPPSHSNRTTSVSPPNLSITQIPTGTSISPSNLMNPLSGGILSKKPSVTITPSYKQNACAPTPSSISPPLFLFSDTYSRLNESKSSHESTMSIKTFNSLVNNNRTLPEQRRNMPDKHAINAGLISAMRNKDLDFLKVAELDKIVESINVVKNSETYETHFKPRRSRKGNNKKLSPMEMVETEMGEDSGDMMGPAPLEPEVIINEDPDSLEIGEIKVLNEEVQRVQIETNEEPSLPIPIEISNEKIEHSTQERVPVESVEQKIKVNPEVDDQPKDSEIIIESEKLNGSKITLGSTPTTTQTVEPLNSAESVITKPIKILEQAIENIESNQTEENLIVNEPDTSVGKRTRKSNQHSKELEVESIINDLIEKEPQPEAIIGKRPRKYKEITEGTEPKPIQIELELNNSIESEVIIESSTNEIEVVKKGKSKRINSKKSKAKIVEHPQVVELLKPPSEFVTKIIKPIANALLLENPQSHEINDDTKSQDDSQMSMAENENTQTQEESSVSDKPREPQTKTRRKRQSELTAIIADQLLESFKEVDKSRIDELKLLHVLSLESSQTDDILLPVVHSTPKRKAAVIKKIDEGKFEKPKPTKKPPVKKRSAPVTEESIEPEPDTTKEVMQVDEPPPVSEHIEDEKVELEQVSPKRRSARLTTTSASAEISAESQIMPETTGDIEKHVETIIKPTRPSGRIKGRRMTIHQTTRIDIELEERVTVVENISKEAESIYEVVSDIGDIPFKSTKSFKVSSKKVKQSVERSPPIDVENVELEASETPLRRKSARNQAKQDDSSKQSESLSNSNPSENDISQKNNNTVHKEDQTSSNESEDDLCLAQFAKNALNKTVNSATREDVISSISDTHPIDAEYDIQNTKRSVEFNLDQNNVKVLNPLQFDDFDDNTNTELVDMDLEDETMSVYTSISIDTSITLNPLGIRKKRKRRSILLKPRKQRGPKFDDSNMLEYECELCNKVFRKQESLSKHKMTLTHIAKLSEQEFLNSKNQKPDEPPIISPLRENLPSILTPVRIEVEKPLVPLILESPKKLPPITTNNSGIEPISSPEHTDGNYDRYSSISPQKENSRFNLSQEEKLFFECCNMLKGSSDQANTNLTNAGTATTQIDSILLNNGKSLNKTNGNMQANLLFSNSQRPLFMSSPKVDPNQFSDISSDSNPAIFHKNKLNLSALDVLELNKNKGISHNIFIQAEMLKSSSILQHPEKQPTLEYPPNSEHSTVAPLPGNSMHINNYSDLLSDMGDSFPSSQDASESEHYSQTVLERSSLKLDGPGGDIFARKLPHFTAGQLIEKVNANSVPYYNVASEACGDEAKQIDIRTTFESPIHSNSSQSSTTSKFITKGALKGYDNFKVSIPTIGIDLQQALVRSSHIGSKLATLADIALSSDVPATAGLFRDDNIKATESIILEEPIIEQINQTNPVIEKLSEPLTITIDTNVPLPPQPTTPVSPKKISPKIPEIKITTRTTSNRRSNGNKLGFKAKKHLKQQAKRNKAKQQRNKTKILATEQEKRSFDVYEFEDSFDSVDAPIIPLSKVAGGFRAKLLTKEMVELGAVTGIEDSQSPTSKNDKTGVIPGINPSNEESQMSSTSFSDRDDFNFGVDSGVSESSDDSESEHESMSPGLNKLPDTTNNLQKKCLIMGRIFKNAKKSQPQPVEVVGAVDGKCPEKMNKLPKQELDKLFDSLKEVENKLSAEQSLNENSNLSRLFGEGQTKNKKNNKKGDTGGGNRKSKKSREMQMLEAEMGMSLEQIKEIIGVGQRKSQRKCATAKPKILAETWSSDEYEDFHTTKDIIALIQETEIKALQRRNRNKNTNKDKSETSEKIQNTSANSNDVSINKILVENEKQNDEEDDEEEEDPVSSIVEPSSIKAIDKKSKSDETVNVEYQKGETKIDFPLKDKKENNSNVNNKKSVKIKTPPQRRKSMSANNSAAAVKPQRLVYYDSESDFEADWNRSSKRSKIKKRRKTTAFKEINKAVDRKSPKTAAPPKLGKQRATTSDVEAVPPKINENRVKNIKISDDAVVETEGKDSKIPMSRRKRIASEMLYYWSSSSSDDEFGRVGGSSRRRRNRNRPVEHHHQQDDDEDDDADDDELTQNGEHLQQHGWIVGDSHKKLVTLLAHAKGKMTDDCGVKESGNKKKS